MKHQQSGNIWSVSLLLWFQKQKLIPKFIFYISFWKIIYVFGVLFISLVAGYFTLGFLKGSTRSILVLGAILSILLPAFFIKNPNIGITVFIPASLLIPFSLGTGTESSINVSMMLVVLLVGVYFIDFFVLKRRKLETPQPTVIVLFLFMAYAVFCFGFGQIRWYPIDPAPLRSQIGGLGIFLLSGFAYLLAAYMIDDLRILKRIVFSFLGVGAIIIVVAAFPNLNFWGGFLQNGATGSLFWLWLVSLSFSQGLCNNDLPRFWRISLLVLPFAALIHCLSPTMIVWSSGYLPAMITIATISFIAKPRWRPFLIGAVILVIIFKFQPIINLVMQGDNTYSLSTRTAAWEIIGGVIKINPFFGLGFANYHWYVQLFPIMGYAVTFNSHNNYVDIVAQTGFIGLFIFAWFMWSNWRLSWKLLGLVHDGFARAFIFGALGGLVGTLAAAMLGDWFLPFVYNIGLSGFRASVLGWLFLGCIVAIYRIYEKKKIQE